MMITFYFLDEFGFEFFFNSETCSPAFVKPFANYLKDRPKVNAEILFVKVRHTIRVFRRVELLPCSSVKPDGPYC